MPESEEGKGISITSKVGAGVGGTAVTAWSFNEIYDNIMDMIQTNNEAIQELIHLHLR